MTTIAGGTTAMLWLMMSTHIVIWESQSGDWQVAAVAVCGPLADAMLVKRRMKLITMMLQSATKQ